MKGKGRGRSRGEWQVFFYSNFNKIVDKNYDDDDDFELKGKWVKFARFSFWPKIEQTS